MDELEERESRPSAAVVGGGDGDFSLADELSKRLTIKDGVNKAHLASI